MSGQVLNLSYVVTVTVLPTPAQLGTPLINTILLVSQEVPNVTLGGAGGVYGVYTDMAAVATDWGINSNAYAIAQSIFSQTPNPVESDGYLIIVPRLQSPTLETVRAALTRFGSTAFYYGVLIDEEMDAEASEFAKTIEGK